MSSASSSTVPSAVILAAGMGTRLQAVHGGSPKGFVEVGGMALIERSLTQLQRVGVSDIVLVAGWREEAYRDLLARRFPSLQLAINADYATTGSLASLLMGTRGREGDVLVVESDLLYESRALSELMAAPSADTLLASGPTGSGDEVWVHGREGRLSRLTKGAWPGDPRVGELVGLTRLSAATVARLREVAPALPAAAHYEDGLNAICGERRIALLLVPDLLWCEVDDADHLARAREIVWPRLSSREAALR